MQAIAEPVPIMTFVDDLSRHYYDHQFVKQSLLSLLEAKMGEIKIGKDNINDNSAESPSSLPQNHPILSPSISIREIDGEKEKDVVKEELISCIPFIPEVCYYSFILLF